MFGTKNLLIIIVCHLSSTLVNMNRYLHNDHSRAASQHRIPGRFKEWLMVTTALINVMTQWPLLQSSQCLGDQPGMSRA